MHTVCLLDTEAIIIGATKLRNFDSTSLCKIGIGVILVFVGLKPSRSDIGQLQGYVIVVSRIGGTAGRSERRWVICRSSVTLSVAALWLPPHPPHRTDRQCADIRDALIVTQGSEAQSSFLLTLYRSPVSLDNMGE